MNGSGTLFDTFTVHCFFQRWCSHKVTGIDPQANHEEMEAHYQDKHYGVHLGIVEREVNGTMIAKRVST